MILYSILTPVCSNSNYSDYGVSIIPFSITGIDSGMSL